MNLEFPQTTRPFFGLGGHLRKTRMSLLEAKRNLLKLSRKEIFCPQFSLGDTLLVTHDPSPHNNEVFRVLTIQFKKKKSKTKFCIFIKLDKKQYFKLYSHQKYTVIKNAHTSLGISSTVRFLCLVCFGISVFCRIIRILTSIRFPLLPLGYLLSLLYGAFLGLDSDLGGAVLAGFLCGMSFTLTLSSLASPRPFFWAWLQQAANISIEHRYTATGRFVPSCVHPH